MSIVSRRGVRRKADRRHEQRHVRYFHGSPGLLELEIPGCQADPRFPPLQHYWLQELAVDFGRGFEVRKSPPAGIEPDGAVYHVHLDEVLGDTCTCKGATYHGHCKHISAIRALIASGRLLAGRAS
jgi:hypothetical protein